MDGILIAEAMELREEKKKIRALEKQDDMEMGKWWCLIGKLGPFFDAAARDSARNGDIKFMVRVGTSTQELFLQ